MQHYANYERGMTGPVRSVSHAFSILRLLADRRPLSLSDIARLAELSPSSCLNLLKTLVEEGVIEREARTKFYRLTQVWASSEALRDGTAQALADRALPLLGQFAQTGDAAVALWQVISRDRMRLVSHAESDAAMRIRIVDGQRQPLGGGAAGRALGAAQRVDDAELARRYAAVHWQAELSLETYIDQVHRAEEKGFAIDGGFAHRGICTVAVAIAEIDPGFCISASVFAGSRSTEEIAAIGAELVRLRSILLIGK